MNSLDVAQLSEAFFDEFLLFRGIDGFFGFMESLLDEGFDEILHTLIAGPLNICLNLLDELLG